MDQIGLNPAVIHALWTMHGLGALDGAHAEATEAAAATRDDGLMEYRLLGPAAPPISGGRF